MQKGDKARSGTDEYFKIWIFGAEDHERTICGRGESIMVYDPSTENAEPYWVRENIEIEESTVVPAGYVVRVIKATVRFI